MRTRGEAPRVRVRLVVDQPSRGDCGAIDHEAHLARPGLCGQRHRVDASAGARRCGRWRRRRRRRRRPRWRRRRGRRGRPWVARAAVRAVGAVLAVRVLGAWTAVVAVAVQGVRGHSDALVGAKDCCCGRVWGGRLRRDRHGDDREHQSASHRSQRKKDLRPGDGLTTVAHAAAESRLSGCRESTSEREMEQHLGWGVGHSRHSEQPAGFAPPPGKAGGEHRSCIERGREPRWEGFCTWGPQHAAAGAAAVLRVQRERRVRRPQRVEEHCGGASPPSRAAKMI